MTAAYAVMDEALDLLSPYGPDLQNGMTSHAPMAAEAMCAVDRPDAVMPWLRRYSRGMLPRPAAGERIAGDDWRTALMRSDRCADWSAFFADQLRDDPWRIVLERWVARLTPGISAAAAHGVIRVGHAVRSLAERQTPLRVGELADALGYWAANYQELPTRSARAAIRRRPAAAIAQVPIMPPERRVFHGSIVSSLVALNDFPDFDAVIDLIDVSGEATVLINDLGEVFARVYLANAHDSLTSIVFVHAVTSIAALGHIIPYLSAATAREAARFAWQAACGLYATFGQRPLSTHEIDPSSEDPDTLVDMAIAHGDEHVIKFTEACLGLHAQRPSPVFLAAARSAMQLLPPV